MDDLRKEILVTEELVASKRRFGLFSQPPPIAVGDDSVYKPTIHQRNQYDGKPVTNPPQMLAGTCKTGLTKSSYFNVPKSIYIDDKYEDQYKVDKKYEKKHHSRASFHQQEFKPSFGGKTESRPSYTYIQQSITKKPPERDENGKIKTKLPNILTNSTKRVQNTFFKSPSYQSEPYDRPQLIRKKEKQQHKKKIIHDEIFRSMSQGSLTFSKDSIIYGQDQQVKLLANKKRKTKSIADLNQVRHDAKFVPARRGHGDPINKYPEAVKSKEEEIIVKKLPKINTMQNPQKWNHNNFGYSRPTPSISSMKRNLNIGQRKK